MKRLLLFGSLLLAAAPLVAPVSSPGQDDDDAPKGPQVGQPAPAFRLNTHEGKAASVGGESETWTVLAFFPKAATPG